MKSVTLEVRTLPVKMVEQVDARAIIESLAAGAVLIFDCTFSQMKTVNTVARKMGYKFSGKSVCVGPTTLGYEMRIEPQPEGQKVQGIESPARLKKDGTPAMKRGPKTKKENSK